MSAQRRLKQVSYEQCWLNLSIAQKSSINELTQFGFKLSFVRTDDEPRIAVATSGKLNACVTEDGEIYMNSNYFDWRH